MEREHAREVRLKNMLLMVLRIAIVVALALAAARPVGWLPGVGHAPSAVAIVLDNSLSSAASGAEGQMLARLVAAAGGIIDGSASGDRLWLITMDGAVVGGDKGTLRAALSGVRALDGAGDAGAALRRGTALVKESGIPSRHVVVLTDAQRTSWEGVVPPADAEVPVALIAPGGTVGLNRAVIAVATEPQHWDPRGTVRATVAGNDSASWRVVLDGRTLARVPRSRARPCSRVQPALRMGGRHDRDRPDELRGDDARHLRRMWASLAHRRRPPSGPFLRGAVEALVQGGRARCGNGVLLAAPRARAGTARAERSIRSPTPTRSSAGVRGDWRAARSALPAPGASTARRRGWYARACAGG
jgi:hypothetical protein